MITTQNNDLTNPIQITGGKTNTHLHINLKLVSVFENFTHTQASNH